ncbi:MAG: AsmA family protein, partial [Betaproteobacteria bacterium]|nr:AsmA family protein [Betaproteobacteria bacterium]
QAQAQRAREEAESRGEAERKAREAAEAKAEAERKAREEAEAEAETERKSRDEAVRKAKEEAENKARAEVEAIIETERKAREASERKAQAEIAARTEAEKKARAEAERQAEAARHARAEAERRAREASESNSAAAQKARAEAEFKAKAAEAAVKQAREVAEKERNARAEAEERAKQEAVARVMQEQQLRAKTEDEVKARVEAELKAYRQKEVEADAKYRAEAEKRARAAAAERKKKMGVEDVPAVAPKTEKKTDWKKISGIGAIVLLVLLVGLIHLVPLTPYAEGVAKLVSQRLQQPVAIGSMRYALIPYPQLTLERVAIGKAEEIKIERIEIGASPLIFFGEQKDIDSIEAILVSVESDALAHVPGWLRPQSGPQPLRIGRVRMKSVRLALHAAELPAFDVDVTLGRNGAMQRASLTDGRARVSLIPKETSLQLNLEARDWLPPLGPPVTFDDLTLTAVITGETATISAIEAKIGSGVVKGEASAAWDNGARAQGELSIANGELRRLMPEFTRDFSAAGSVGASITFELEGRTLPALFDKPRVNATFNVSSGVLSNVDLVRAMQSPTREGTRGGRTPFDVLTGTLQLSDNHYAYRQLRLASGPMNATGSVDVAPNGKLSGRINAVLGSGSVVVARGTVGVSGFVKLPVLGPESR